MPVDLKRKREAEKVGHLVFCLLYTQVRGEDHIAWSDEETVKEKEADKVFSPYFKRPRFCLEAETRGRRRGKRKSSVIGEETKVNR